MQTTGRTHPWVHNTPKPPSSCSGNRLSENLAAFAKTERTEREERIDQLSPPHFQQEALGATDQRPLPCCPQFVKSRRKAYSWPVLPCLLLRILPRIAFTIPGLSSREAGTFYRAFFDTSHGIHDFPYKGEIFGALQLVQLFPLAFCDIVSDPINKISPRPIIFRGFTPVFSHSSYPSSRS
jgi:hypothetical protein